MSLKSTSLVTNVLIYPSLHFDTDHLFCPRPFIAHSSFFFNNSLCDINLLMTEKLFLDRGHTLTFITQLPKQLEVFVNLPVISILYLFNSSMMMQYRILTTLWEHGDQLLSMLSVDDTKWVSWLHSRQASLVFLQSHPNLNMYLCNL